MGCLLRRADDGSQLLDGAVQLAPRRPYGRRFPKTFSVPISRLYRAFSIKRTRDRWLPDIDMKIRTSTTDKSMRITWPDATSVHAYFTGKGPKKSQVAIQHVGLVDKKDIARRKDYWSERFSALAEIL